MDWKLQTEKNYMTLFIIHFHEVQISLKGRGECTAGITLIEFHRTIDLMLPNNWNIFCISIPAANCLELNGAPQKRSTT